MKLARLGEVAAIERDGIAPEKIVAGTPYLGLEHIESGGRIISSEPVANGELASTKFQFGPEHLLYGKLRPYLAKIALPDFAGICSTDILPVKAGPDLDKRYLAYFLRQPRMVDFANSRSSGANLPRLSPKALADFQIPLPPLPEQRRIAGILDQADALRHKRADALSRLNALGQAIFYEMFGDLVTNPNGWPERTFAQIAKRITVGIVVKPASYYRDTGVPALRGTNIKSNGIDLSDVVYFSEQDNETILSKTRIWTDDLVIVRSGRPGLAALVPPELSGANAIDVLILTPDEKVVHPRFVRDLINSTAGRRIILSESRGQVQQHFNVGSLSKAELFLPPYDLQTQYVERMKGLENVLNRQVIGKLSLDSLFFALQHRAFRGEL